MGRSKTPPQLVKICFRGMNLSCDWPWPFSHINNEVKEKSIARILLHFWAIMTCSSLNIIICQAEE
jgi:hypothetical protein